MVPELVLEVVETLKNRYTVSKICDCLEIARSTYYRWVNKAWEPTEVEQLIIETCKSLKYRIEHRMVKKLLEKDHKAR